METNLEADAPVRTTRRRGRSWIVTAAVATGLAVGAAGLAGAATGSTGSSSTNPSAAASGAPAGANGTARDPSTMKQGPGETLLTGDTATKVQSAAVAAVPGATVIRVETDSAGAAYEAHLKKADGTFVTVRFDANFKITSTDNGFGPGPQGQAPPASASGVAGASSSTSN